MAKQSLRAPSERKVMGRWVYPLCLAIVVFFGLSTWLGPRVAALAAVALGLLVGVVVRALPKRSSRVVSAGDGGAAGIVASNGCRFIPLDAGQIDAAIEVKPVEKAAEGAIPPRLNLPNLPANAAEPDEKPGGTSASGPMLARPNGSGLRLAGRPTSPSPSPAAPPVSRSAVSGGGRRLRGGSAQAEPAASAEDDSAGKKKCPECGQELRQRLAMEGPMAGRFVWGCRAFPKCRYAEAPEPAGQASVPASN